MSKVPFDAIKIGAIDQLARTWGLTEWEKLDELNMDYFWEYASRARDQAQEDDGIEDEEELEQIGQEAEQKIRDEMFESWSHAVETTSEKLLEVVDLTIEKTELGNYYIYPSDSWRESLKKIIEIVHAIGHFHFARIEDLLDSGPYGLREAVSKHYEYIRQAHETFDVPSPEKLYERNFRDV